VTIRIASSHRERCAEQLVFILSPFSGGSLSAAGSAEEPPSLADGRHRHRFMVPLRRWEAQRLLAECSGVEAGRGLRVWRVADEPRERSGVVPTEPPESQLRTL
jgi:hypothetical protein